MMSMTRRRTSRSGDGSKPCGSSNADEFNVSTIKRHQDEPESSEHERNSFHGLDDL